LGTPDNVYPECYHNVHKGILLFAEENISYQTFFISGKQVISVTRPTLIRAKLTVKTQNCYQINGDHDYLKLKSDGLCTGPAMYQALQDVFQSVGLPVKFWFYHM
jgi:hypothetical protein